MENGSKRTCLPVSDSTIELFKGYESLLRKMDVEPVQDKSRGQGHGHALWMCLNYPKDDEARASRWLGWVQCLMCITPPKILSIPRLTLDQVREHSRNGKVELK